VPSHAFTLIEVTLATALIAVIIVAIIVARGRLIRQSQHASQVASANVLAGRLVAEWESGLIPVAIGQQQRGEDATTGLSWQLSCHQREVDEGSFLECLDVKVYAKTQEPIVAFEAWQSLR
jgi:Tfp pilus assembly protein PilV